MLRYLLQLSAESSLCAHES
jgi:calpain-7